MVKLYTVADRRITDKGNKMTVKVTIQNKKGTSLGRFVCTDNAHAFSVLSDYAAQHPEEAKGAYIFIEPTVLPSAGNAHYNLPIDAAELQEQAETEGW